MIAPDVLSLPAPPIPTAIEDFSTALTLFEFELSLESFQGGEADFAAAVRDAAGLAGGAYLFDLPAADLIEDCSRIAVLRISDEPDQSLRTILALLDASGASIRVEEPDERTEGLVRFADAFIGVLEQI